MRESFSLFLWNKKDPQTKELRINYYLRIMCRKYSNGLPVWRMIVADTLYDVKRLLRSLVK